MKKLLSIFTILSMVLGCQDDDNIIAKAQLKVTPEKIEVWAEKTYKSFTVESNLNYTIQSETGWIKNLKKDGKTVNFEVEQNSTGSIRSGFISVLSEDKKVSVKVFVNQKATKSIFVSSLNGKIDFKTNNLQSTEKEYSMTIRSEVEYTVKTDVDWIVLGTQNKEKLTFKLKENKTESERKGKISFFANGIEVSFLKITQLGEKSFTLPYMVFGKTAEDLKKYEETRETKLLSDTSTDPNNNGTGGDSVSQLKYQLINNSVFNELQYLANLKGYQKSSLFVKGQIIKEEDKINFEQFLIREGFVEITEKGYKTTLDINKVDKIKFLNKDKQVRVEFMADKKANHYTFTYYPVQQKKLKTLSKLPSFEKGMLEKEIIDNEASNKGILNSKKSKLDYTYKGIKKAKRFYNVINGNESLVARCHFIAKEGTAKGLTQTSFYYQDESLALHGGLDGVYYLTNEFIELAKKSNFTYSNVTAKGYYIFKNGNKSLSVIRYKDESLGWILKINRY